MPRSGVIDGRAMRRLLRDYPEMLTVADLAEYLGVCRDTVYAGIQQGTLPGSRLAGAQGKIVIPRRAVEEWERRIGERAAGEAAA